MNDDQFFERLRGDARKLRYEPDAATLARIRANIEAALIPQPTVTQLLAAWLRPVLATAAALALAAAIGFNIVRSASASLDDLAVEIGMVGDDAGQ